MATAGLDALRQQARDMEQKLAVLVESRRKALQEMSMSHDTQLSADKENAIATRQKLATVREKAAKSKAVQKERDTAVEAVQKDIADLDKLENELSKKAVSIDAKMEALQSKKQQLAAARERQAEQAGRQSSTISQGVELYQKHLGLEFIRRKDKSLELVFTKIDPAQPTRRFSFSVQVGDDDMYLVMSCTPQLKGIDSLLAELNKSNDFGTFVRSMRAKFKALV